jgi:hypothetical protein
MRRHLFLLIFLVFVISRTCKADPFQFVDARTGAFASYARVEIDGTPLGYTDLYGRISISRPPGEHVCRVTYSGRTFELRLSVTGDVDLKRVELSQ